MEIRLLGPVEVTVDDHQVALGGAKQRGVLAMLALRANRTVSAERLIDGLWEDPQPPSAPKMVQNYVWRLRKLLGETGTSRSARTGAATSSVSTRRPSTWRD